MDRPAVLDQEGRPKSWDWLVATLGPLRVERASPTMLGQPIFRLVEVRVVEGTAVQVVSVSDPRGIPLEGVQAIRSWPGAPDLPQWPAPASRWQRQGVHSPTGRNGAVGFWLGAADTYRLPDPGPVSVWVADLAGPSDRVDGLGLLVSGGRLHADVHFRLEQELEPLVLAEKPEMRDERPGPLVATPQAAFPAALVWPAPAAALSRPPPSPPEPPAPPLRLSGEQWQLLIERLDEVIRILEEQASG